MRDLVARGQRPSALSQIETTYGASSDDGDVAAPTQIVSACGQGYRPDLKTTKLLGQSSLRCWNHRDPTTIVPATQYMRFAPYSCQIIHRLCGISKGACYSFWGRLCSSGGRGAPDEGNRRSAKKRLRRVGVMAIPHVIAAVPTSGNPDGSALGRLFF